jgi:ABC-2 type transport system ATP-binding protein
MGARTVSTAMPAIAVDALVHRYGDREALRGVSFEVAEGEILGLLGPNGGGKTTLFRVLSTLLRPTSGTVRVGGFDVGREPRDVRRQLGVVFQSPALDPLLPVGANLQCHGALYGLHGHDLEQRIVGVLEALSLSDRRHSMVKLLSGGLQRRVEIAKALIPDPRVLALDEPSSGLDPNARREVWEHLHRRRADHGTTVLLTTHAMDEAAMCDRVAILHEGRLVAVGTPGELTATIGGDILWITTRSPQAAADRLTAEFGVAADVVDGRVRIERQRAHEFVPAVIEAFRGEVEAVTFSRPTLEDVFVHHTGRRFD